MWLFFQITDFTSFSSESWTEKWLHWGSTLQNQKTYLLNDVTPNHPTICVFILPLKKNKKQRVVFFVYPIFVELKTQHHPPLQNPTRRHQDLAVDGHLGSFHHGHRGALLREPGAGRRRSSKRLHPMKTTGSFVEQKQIDEHNYRDFWKLWVFPVFSFFICCLDCGFLLRCWMFLFMMSRTGKTLISKSGGHCLEFTVLREVTITFRPRNTVKGPSGLKNNYDHPAWIAGASLNFVQEALRLIGLEAT